MKGIILAAGKGTRLYPITQHIPKPLLPIANRMTLEYAFDRLKEIGVHDICVVVGENEDAMKASLGTGHSFGVKLTYVRQLEPKGLAHALGFAQEFAGDDNFVMYLGDAIYENGFEDIAKRFLDSGCANLNLVKWVEDPSRFGVANLEGEKIVKLVEKPKEPESNYAMAGLYFFGPQIWSVLPDLKPSGRGEYEITDAIQMLIDRNHLVLAGVYEGAWFDTGTLPSFLETTAFLTDKGPLIGEGANVNALVSGATVIGQGSHVECKEIIDSVVMPGSQINVSGAIKNSILAGNVQREGDIMDSIEYGA